MQEEKVNAFTEFDCAECGKHVVLPFGTGKQEYAYQMKDLNKRKQFFCGWNCLCKGKAKKEASRKRKRRPC